MLYLVAALNALGFVAAVLTAHRLRNDLPAREATLSAYFGGRTRGLMLAGYLALAFALLATSTMLARAAPYPPPVFAALVCLLTAVCLIPIALTAPRDLSSADTRSLLAIRLHRWAALLAFVSIVMAILSFAIGATQHPSAQAVAFALGAVALLALLAMVQFKPDAYHGVLQKILVTAVVVWIWLVSVSEGMASQ